MVRISKQSKKIALFAIVGIYTAITFFKLLSGGYFWDKVDAFIIYPIFIFAAIMIFKAFIKEK